MNRNNKRITSTLLTIGSNIRPVISWKPNTMYIEGDGSKDTPYIIETQ